MLKRLAILALLLAIAFMGFLYFVLRAHIDDLPPAKAKQCLHYYIGDTQYQSVTRAECSVLGGFHLDNFTWFRFPCATDDLQRIVGHITAENRLGSVTPDTATFQQRVSKDGEQVQDMLIDGELHSIAYIASWNPAWWNRDILDGKAFYRFLISRRPGHIDLFYDAATQMAFMYVVEG